MRRRIHACHMRRRIHACEVARDISAFMLSIVGCRSEITFSVAYKKKIKIKINKKELGFRCADSRSANNFSVA
jgi:hypothetical protein